MHPTTTKKGVRSYPTLSSMKEMIQR